MQRSILAVAGLAVLVVGVLTTIWFISTKHEIRRSQEYIQEKINAHLPKTSHDITARAARVSLENNHVVLLASIDGTHFKKNFSMMVEAVGVPDYKNSHNGEFFFLPEQIGVYDFQIDDPNPRSLFNHLPERFKGKIETWMVRVAERGAVLALEKVPVYKLKDDNLGWIVRSSLESVRIDGKELVITYSIWNLTVWVMIWIGIIILVLTLICIMIACPDVAIAFLEIFSLFG